MITPRRLIYLLTAILLVFLLGNYFFSPGHPTESIFVIKKGENANSIATRLAEADFIRSRTIFLWEIYSSGAATKFQPGEHNLVGVTSYQQIIERLTMTNITSPEVVLLIREGETLRDVKLALEMIGVDSAADLYKFTGEAAEFPIRSIVSENLSLWRRKYSWLESAPKNVGLEGFLFPDTYRLYQTTGIEDVIEKMLANFDRKITPELRASIAASGRSLYEVLIMASILEHEVRNEQDLRLTADLFWRRFDIGMRLQADSTVNYIIDGRRPALTQADTQLDSPYNTYKYAGLPPTPIGNPGLIAIQAAVNPEPNPYWYFLTDTSGAVHYARTLEEHNYNKVKFLK
jgi:UPF0755 protein